MNDPTISVFPIRTLPDEPYWGAAVEILDEYGLVVELLYETEWKDTEDDARKDAEKWLETYKEKCNV
jgi:hypothetical protein